MLAAVGDIERLHVRRSLLDRVMQRAKKETVATFPDEVTQEQLCVVKWVDMR